MRFSIRLWIRLWANRRTTEYLYYANDKDGENGAIW